MDFVFLLSSGGIEQHLTCNSRHRRRIVFIFTPFPQGNLLLYFCHFPFRQFHHPIGEVGQHVHELTYASYGEA